MKELEEGSALSLDYQKLRRVADRDQDVIPVVLQHADTNEVLWVAYANQLALRETLATRKAVLWSTSRNELWRKGESSGDVLELVDVRVNCEQNSILYRVRPIGGCCHTKNPEGVARPTCFYRTIAGEDELEFNQP
jgi:phosphoribosyl-AMP cyclohydrolase